MFEDYDYYDVDDGFIYDGEDSDDDEYYMNADDVILDDDDIGSHRIGFRLADLRDLESSVGEAEKNLVGGNKLENEHEKKTKAFVADHIASFFNKSKCCDVNLRVGPNMYYSHKIVLCAWSEVFRKMFVDPMWTSPRKGETNGPGPQLQPLMEPEECLDVFPDFLKFMYTETVDLSPDNVYPILMLADKYMVQELRDVCEDFLVESLANASGEVALSTYAEVERLGLMKVQDHCVQILEGNFNYLAESCVQSICIDLLLRLLASNNLVVEEELDVFNVAVKWLHVEEQQGQRSQYAKEIFSLVRFQHIPAEKLKMLTDMTLTGLEMEVWPHLNGLIAKAFEWRALVAEEAYSVMCEDYIEPRIYQMPTFTVHSSKRYMNHNGNDSFRKLPIFDENQEDVYHTKLSFTVASAFEKNIYKFNKSWELSATTKRDTVSSPWYIKYFLQSYNEVGKPYRLAIITQLKEDESDSNPVIALQTGTVQNKMSLSVRSALFNQVEKPSKVWVKCFIFVSAQNK